MKNPTNDQHHTPAATSTASGISTVPGKVGATLPTLHPGETYIGISLGADGIERHVILLVGDAPVTSIEDAEDFVASVYGELPTYAELAHIHACVAGRLKPTLYYTCEQEDCDGDVGTMLFDGANAEELAARGGVSCIRVRAVRRVLANLDIEPAIGITAHQVDAVSGQLLRQYTALIDKNSDDGDRMVNAGIRVGIGLMAMSVQQVLAAMQRQQGGAHA
jgi:hypothetical protein